MLGRIPRSTQNVVKPESNSTCGYILSTVPGPFAGCDSHSPGKGPGRTESGAKLQDQFEHQTLSERLYNIILHILFFLCVCASLTLLECPKSAEFCPKTIAPFLCVSPLCQPSPPPPPHHTNFSLSFLRESRSQISLQRSRDETQSQSRAQRLRRASLEPTREVIA